MKQAHRWIEKCNMKLLTAVREKSAWLGWTCGQNGLFGDLCESLEMSRTTVAEMAPAPPERGGEGQICRTAPKPVQNLQMGGYCVSRGFQSLWECRWFYRESAQQSTGAGSWGMAPVCEKRENKNLKVWWLRMLTSQFDICCSDCDRVYHDSFSYG